MLDKLILLILLLILMQISISQACEEKNKKCIVANQTREVNGAQITKNCWQYQYELDCAKESKYNCNNIDLTNCTLVEEKCAERITRGGIEFCVENEQHFACEKQTQYEEEKVQLRKNNQTLDSKDLLCNVMCLDGNCGEIKKAKYELNQEIASATAMLNALKDAKQSISGNTLINIFKGQTAFCDRKLTNYTNCCKISGWGTKLGIVQCSPESKNLAKKRKEKKCIEVGAYCASKFLGLCVIKRTAFCCYDSIVGKLLNQEAKQQLHKNNGTSEHPQCDGLSLEEIHKVDFNKTNFTEFYDQIIVPNIRISNIDMDIATNSQSVHNIENNSINEENQGFNQYKLEDIKS